MYNRTVNPVVKKVKMIDGVRHVRYGGYVSYFVGERRRVKALEAFVRCVIADDGIEDEPADKEVTTAIGNEFRKTVKKTEYSVYEFWRV